MATITPQEFAQAVRAELLGDIVPFWSERALDRERGGFVGHLSREGVVDPTAPKGLILNARLLWTFSAFARELGDAACLKIAERAYDYLEAHFWDREHGGAFWEVAPDGQPRDMKKKVYGQAFLAYGLTEFHRAAGSEPALRRAIKVFELIETHARDESRGGYRETYERDWRLAADARLSAIDLNEQKSMNNHLHVMEAYTNLLRVWPNDRLRTSLVALIEIFLATIVDARTHHLRLFFDDAWTVKSDRISFGHDIEASWLLCEAAEVVGDASLTRRVHAQALRTAEATLLEGVDADGGLLYEAGPEGRLADSDKHWWPQTEALVGFLNAFELSRESRYYAAAWNTWRFIERRLLDRQYGEWFYKVSRSGEPDLAQPKISTWKCPYHNGRMCLEALRRLARLPA
jgi:mannobiose 2-epimerase